MRTAALGCWSVWLFAAASIYADCPSAPNTAQDWIDCGLKAEQSGRYPDAQQAYDKAREIAERAGDRARVAHALEGSGQVRQFLGDPTTGETLLRESLHIREELADEPGIADSLAALGRFYIASGDDLKIREYSGRALKLYQKLGNHVGAAAVMNNIGISWKPHDVLMALDYFEKSMEEFESLGDERRANVVRTNVAFVHYQLGDVEGAIELSDAALATWNRIGAGEKAGITETSLGLDYLELGDFRKALRFLNEALDARVKMEYKFGVAESRNNLALVYMAQGDYGQAEASLAKCIALSRELDNRDLESEALGILGAVQYLAGKHAEGVKSMQASLALAEKLDAKQKIAEAAYGLGRVYLTERQLKEAATYLGRALETEEQIHDGLTRGPTLVALSELELKRGNFDESRIFAQRALTLSEQNGQSGVQWTALAALGHAEKQLGHRDRALADFDRAIDVLEDLRTRVAGDENQSALFFADKVEPYEERMRLALEAGNPSEAFVYSERARARALLDTVNKHRPPLDKAMTPDERAQERKLRLVLNALSRQMQASPENADALRKRQNQARLDYEAFQTKLFAAHPELRVARAQVTPIAAKEIGTLLPGPSSALLEYAVTEDRCWLFAATSEGLRSFELRISRTDLSRRIERFRQQLASRDLRVDQAAGELYGLLLGPAGAVLRGKTEWIIAPDGPLWNLPFQALESNPSRFVIEDASISYAQSFTALREEMQMAARRRATPGSLLGFGDPAGRDPLPEAARQIQAVAAVYRPNSRAYTGAEASESAWKQEAPHYRILQFATHAVFDDRSPLYSYIALAQPGPGSPDDGLLEAWEIMQLDLNAELAVLSACETARGSVTPGEGLVGLTWSLFVAGTPSALVTQWKVDAARTGDLMIQFHRAWHGGAGGVSKSRALQSAQLSLLHRPGSHPFDWAGVMLIGDAR